MRNNLLLLVVAIAVMVSATPAGAVPIVTGVELYNTWSSPGNVSSPTFNFTGTSGFTATLNGSQQVSSIAAIAVPPTYTIDGVATYESSTGVDVGEGGTLSTRVNSEISVWDDVGVISEAIDTDLNADFNGTSTPRLLLALPALGFTTLIVAEDAGIDPFRMFWCEDAACSSGETQLLNGATVGGGIAIALNGFGLNDSGSDVDQAWVFNFQSPVTGFIGFNTLLNPGGEALELDFVGGTLGPSQVPEPGTIVLFGTGLLGLATWSRRRRKI
jgi:hypothetical protein